MAEIAKLSVGREAYYTRELATDHEAYLSGHGENRRAPPRPALKDDGTFMVFRGAKLRLSDVDPSVLQRALRRGRRLVGSFGLRG